MGRAITILSGILLPATVLLGADVGRCELTKNLYEDRLALAQKQGPAETAAGALLPAGTNNPSDRLAGIDSEYHGFFTVLAAAMDARDETEVKACCERASSDRAGALVCSLALYLNEDRKESAPFLEQFPSSRKETNMLWELNSIAGAAGTKMFPPKGPSYKLVDELFLLLMDERDTAINKYFNLAAHVGGEEAAYMDSQIQTFLKEAPSAVVHQWLVLRRYRPKLKSAAQAIVTSSSTADMLKLVKVVRSFCDKSNPDCPDILKLYSGK